MKFESDPNSRIAIVTGTTAGLGAAVASQLVEREWLVIGIARRPSPMTHERYRHIAFDLGDIGRDAGRLAAQLESHLADVHVTRVGLVNNAAAPQGLMPLAQLDPSQLAHIHTVNVIAPLWLMGFAVRKAGRHDALRIVNVSSGAATGGFPGLAAYGSSKAALRLAGMSLASEWDAPATRATAPTDAAILSYEPGIVDTDMQRYARSRSPDEFPWVGMFLDFHARGLAVAPERPAREIVAFLESDREPHFAERRFRP
jgi:benzil reductase ((S)-benzoin forming)